MVKSQETGKGSSVILMDEIATSERHHLPRREKKIKASAYFKLTKRRQSVQGNDEVNSGSRQSP